MDDQPKPSARRQRHITQRREAILDAAASVFTAKGYSGASIKDIAEAADVADGTIYNYFANKEALLLGLFDRLVDLERVDNRVASAAADNLDDAVIGYFGVHLAHVRAHYDVFRAIIPEVLSTPDLRQRYYGTFVAPLLAVAEAQIHARISQGQLRQIDEQQAARVVYALFFGLLCLRVLGDEAIQPSESTDAALLNTINHLLLRGWSVSEPGDD
ncbi:MAG: TetR/AcrR family transcriptional regulator [Chloroflexi bacterium]|nr:TetR/AcrR family transcriptional regulator [Chloroflexota bacterium]